MLQQAWTTGINGRSTHHTAHTTPLQRLKLVYLSRVHRLFLRGSNDRAGYGVLRIAFQSCRQCQRLGFGNAVHDGDVDHALFPFGQGACFVKDDGVQLAAASSASRSRTRIPLRADSAVVMATTNGTAKPSAWGQAMTSTVTTRLSTSTSKPVAIIQMTVVNIADPNAA